MEINLKVTDSVNVKMNLKVMVQVKVKTGLNLKLKNGRKTNMGYHTLHLNREEFEHIFDMQTLENHKRWAERDVQLLKDQIATSEEYVESISRQMELVSSTETEPFVYIQRTHIDSVKFYVGVKHVPKVDFESFKRDLYVRSSEKEFFEGRQRHEALAYAESLAVKYDCEIRRTGFPKKK